jgi:hypothetical protein
MRGHEPLIAMRRAGKVPGSVALSLYAGTPWRTWAHADPTAFRGFPDAQSTAHVLVEPTDPIARLDLRFLVGLTAWVDGPDTQRVQQLHQACADAGAKRVLSTAQQPDSRGVLRTVAMFDTAGIFEGAC